MAVAEASSLQEDEAALEPPKNFPSPSSLSQTAREVETAPPQQRSVLRLVSNGTNLPERGLFADSTSANR